MNYIKNKLKSFTKKTFRFILEISQRFKVDILPHHFYGEVPDFKELRTETYWKTAHSMIGINGKEIEEQLLFVKECCNKELIDKIKNENIYAHCCFKNNEAGFGPIETDVLYCFIYNKKPKRVIQIGCGLSTAVILLANNESNHKSEIVCIDPLPNNYLKSISNHNEITLISEKAQIVPLETITCLENGDLLFIDSTHTVKPGSEVNKIILEVLPRLKKGTFVHFHDIYFPYNYCRDILSGGLFFPNESALLHAFLINNSKYKIKASLSMLHYAKPKELQQLLPNYRPAHNDYGLKVSNDPNHFPSSIYLEVIA